MIWYTLGIIAIIFLIASFFIGKNAIWGALTLGVIVYIIIGLITLLSHGDFFNWQLFIKITTIATLIGGLFEIGNKTVKNPSNEKRASIIIENFAKAQVDFEMMQTENISPDNPLYKKAKKRYEKTESQFKKLVKEK